MSSTRRWRVYLAKSFLPFSLNKIYAQITLPRFGFKSINVSMGEEGGSPGKELNTCFIKLLICKNLREKKGYQCKTTFKLFKRAKSALCKNGGHKVGNNRAQKRGYLQTKTLPKLCAATEFWELIYVFPIKESEVQTKDWRPKLLHDCSPFTHSGVLCGSRSVTLIIFWILIAQ